MSRSPFFFVEKYNERTKKYELMHPFVWNYDHSEKVPANLFPYNGCHDLFSIVEKNTNSFPVMNGIHHNIPTDSCEEIQKMFKECFEGEEEENIISTVKWFTYADMYIYCLLNPKVVDYEAMSKYFWENDEKEPKEKIFMQTPMMTLKHRIDTFLEIVDEYYEDDYSLIRIVYWIL